MSQYRKPRHGAAVALHVNAIRDGVGAKPDAGTYGWDQSFSKRAQDAARASRRPLYGPDGVVDDEAYAFDGYARDDARAEESAERAETDAIADEWDLAHGASDPILVDPMSDRQRSYLSDLIRSRGTAAHRELDLDDVDRRAASRLIDELRALPYATRPTPVVVAPAPALAPLPVVPAGRYAVELDGVLRFFRVRTDDAGRFSSLLRQSSDDHRPIFDYATRLAVLTAIAADARAAAQRYGQEIGSCGCCGRTLTDADSRANGLGPDCVTHFGERLGR